MKWYLIEHSAKSGKFNMDFDVELANKCAQDEVYLRLYQWQPYAISLGANQPESDLLINKLQADGIDFVKRPTGGRAILHAEELTYSVVFPVSFGFTRDEIYNSISHALIEGLKLYAPSLTGFEMEELQPDFPALAKQPSGMICFNSSAKHEVKINGKKIVGSAQRVYKDTILQHGSILTGALHRKIVDYLNLEESVKNSLSEEMAQKTIELETILKKKTDYEQLRRSIVLGFEKYFNAKFEKIEFVTSSAEAL